MFGSFKDPWQNKYLTFADLFLILVIAILGCEVYYQRIYLNVLERRVTELQKDNLKLFLQITNLSAQSVKKKTPRPFPDGV